MQWGCDAWNKQQNLYVAHFSHNTQIPRKVVMGIHKDQKFKSPLKKGKQLRKQILGVTS